MIADLWVKKQRYLFTGRIHEGLGWHFLGPMSVSSHCADSPNCAREWVLEAQHHVQIRELAPRQRVLHGRDVVVDGNVAAWRTIIRKQIETRAKSTNLGILRSRQKPVNIYLAQSKMVLLRSLSAGAGVVVGLFGKGAVSVMMLLLLLSSLLLLVGLRMIAPGHCNSL